MAVCSLLMHRVANGGFSATVVGVMGNPARCVDFSRGPFWDDGGEVADVGDDKVVDMGIPPILRWRVAVWRIGVGLMLP